MRFDLLDKKLFERTQDILKDFKILAKMHGYSKYADALAWINIIRVYRKETEMQPEPRRKDTKRVDSQLYLNFLTGIPCVVCLGVAGTPRVIVDGEEVLKENRNDYDAIPICKRCFRNKKKMLMIDDLVETGDIRDIIIGFNQSYIRCMEGN
jgi:hypothetical protein